MRLLGLRLFAAAGLVAAASPTTLRAQAPATPRDTSARSDTADADTTAARTLRPVRVVETRRAAYAASSTMTATKTPTLLRDVPQAVTVVARDLIRDAGMHGMADVVRFVPGVMMGQGEGNRDQPTIRGHSTTADFFVDGVRDDAQYFRDLYNVDHVEALKGANAMVFGRGGGGGVLNRVTKDAQWVPVHELLLQGGSFDNKRASLDVGGGVSSRLAARLNGMYERSGFFRNGVTFRRSGVNPTITMAPGTRTRVTLGYEYFADHRTADRGIPSLGGRPISSDIATFFGDPAASYADVVVHGTTTTVTHELTRGLTIRNHTRFTDYDKSYQNVFPGAVSVSGDEVSISAYNSTMLRRNVFSQTDVTSGVRTGSMRHTLLIGAEVGRQVTNNLRNTGYFSDAATSVSVPVRSPTISTPITFRQSATDANNHVVNTVASLYAQDQIALSKHWQLVGGVRYEQFDVRYDDNRTASTLRRVDRMISPRAGVVFKPVELLSLYASHSVSYLPSAGDQFSSLTDVTKALEPERFTNYEVGAKWDVADRLALTVAGYRLDRTNTRAPDPTNPARTLQTGSQRTNGFEIGVTGSITSAWEIAGGYANQDAFITSTTTAATTGARASLVPRHTLSLWNRHRLSRRWGAGVGVIHRSDMFAGIDNNVSLPGFVEIDGALYLTLVRDVRVQANVENLFDATYYVTAHNNNNISPGSPRALRVSIASGF